MTLQDLLLRRRMAAAGNNAPSLPYDAEVDGLKGDGTAYIDLGRKGNKETKIYLKFKPVSTGYFGIAGCRNSNSDSISITLDTQRFGSQSKSTTVSQNVIHEITLDKTGVTLDGTSSSWTQSSSFTTNKNMRVFNAVSTSISTFNGWIYGFKLWGSDELLMDMIPVRVGTTGYMYDKVSGELFGNAAGSGSFTLGDDVTA